MIEQGRAQPPGPPRSRGSRPSAPGILYTALSLVALVGLSSLTLMATQPPPPTVGEFAPQALDRIEDAPDEQASDFGEGTRETGAGVPEDGSVEEAETPEPDPIDVPRVRRCVGDPPRQIEDPQSPPCVPYWDGDNGGATYQGVTRDEIRIAAPQRTAGIQPEQFWDIMATFFNQRFEFYGRQIRFLPMGSSAPATDEEGRAAAAEVDEELQAFASDASTGGVVTYFHELARRGIVSMTWNSQGAFESYQRQFRPYMWSYIMAYDRQQENFGEWACKRLSGRNATHAGDPLMHGQERRFGVVFQHSQESVRLHAGPLIEELGRCGQEVAVDIEVNTRESDSTVWANVALQLKQEGVTSVFFLGVHSQFGLMMKAATAQAYHPEWLISSYEALDNHTAINVLAPGSPDQTANLFGISFVPKQNLPQDTPVTWAVREVEPGYPHLESGAQFRFAELYYHAMLALVSGIQMAGPNLTPETFEQGLHRAAFPNPDHPIMAGTVGFDRGEYSMTNDAAEIWWSNTGRSPNAGEHGGAFCYVDGGARHTRGAWPEGGDPFFSGECDSGADPVRGS